MLYAVIFSAELNDSYPDYAHLAARLRELAVEKYGCIEFASVTEGNRELTISWWETMEDIDRWKQDPEHRKAQQLGRREYYRSYRVQVVKVVREYAVDAGGAGDGSI